jgi:hypothetical protein
MDAGLRQIPVTREQYQKFLQLAADRQEADVAKLVAEERFRKALYRMDGNDRPAYLGEWYANCLLSTRQLRELIGEAWDSADYPEQALGKETWIEMFRECGIVHTKGKRRKPPTKPLDIYRGAVWNRRRGMSWTTDRAQAQKFAERCSLIAAHAYPRHGMAISRLGIPYPKELTRGMVFSASIAPEYVLAMFDDRNEAEVVIDPAGLPPIGRRPVVPIPDRWRHMTGEVPSEPGLESPG